MEDKNTVPRSYFGVDDKSLRDALSGDREAGSAKKRLLYFPAATEIAASICYAVSEDSEKENIRAFFEKHSLYDKHSMDQCSMVHNSWETEFHLSYYQLLTNSSSPRGIPSPRIEEFPGGRGKYIAQTSVGFRFKGDFFDRFWTCHVLECIQEGSFVTSDLLEGREFRQRKIFEQQLFAGILTSLTRSMGDILAEIKDCLDIKSGSFSTSIPSNTAYISWSALWREFEPLIQTLEEDLVNTQITIDQWESREEDRGKEQPRWTRNDERKHRASITRVRRDVKRQKNKLKHLHANVKLLRESCSNRLVRAREELSFRSGQNIAAFTYVTIVFLPLGFTASIFSMNGSPEKTLAINMVTASVIALTVTILALMNAKGLAVVAENISNRFHEVTKEAENSSVSIRDRHSTDDEGTAFDDGDLKPPRLRVSSTDTISSDLAFWVRYLFELPSRSIIAALRALGWPRNLRQDMKGLVGAVAHEIAHGVRFCAGSADDDTGDPEMDRRHVDAGSQERRGKHEYFKKSARVLLGIFAVPVFLPLWTLQILCFYTWDTLTLLGGTYLKIWDCPCGFCTDQPKNAELLIQGIRKISLRDVDGFETRMVTQLTKPSRPIKRFKDHLQSKREALQQKGRNNMGDGKEMVSSREGMSQARR